MTNMLIMLTTIISDHIAIPLFPRSKALNAVQLIIAKIMVREGTLYSKKESSKVR
jgi:hypothetical protein